MATASGAGTGTSVDLVGESPVFLLGAARSGTTLLYRTLCLHPDVAYISNYLRRAPGFTALATLDRLPRHLVGARRGAWFTNGANAYVYGTRRRLVDWAFPAPVEGEPVFTRCGIPTFPPPGGMPAGPVPALADEFRRIRRYAGGRLVVSKRIAHNLRVPLLAATFPRARFVRLVRDGRAVAASLARVNWWPDSHVWFENVTPRAWAAAGRDPWELCARNWVEEIEAIRAGTAGVPTAQLLDVRYEDVIADPITSITSVARFAGLAPDPAWERELARLSFPDRDDQWRTELTGDARTTVEEYQGAHLEELGYAR